MSTTGAPMENQFDHSHIAGHVVSLVAIIGSIAGWLPAVAALAGFIWYMIQIWESETIRNWLERRKHARIRRLQDKVDRLTSKLLD